MGLLLFVKETKANKNKADKNIIREKENILFMSTINNNLSLKQNEYNSLKTVDKNLTETQEVSVFDDTLNSNDFEYENDNNKYLATQQNGENSEIKSQISKFFGKLKEVVMPELEKEFSASNKTEDEAAVETGFKTRNEEIDEYKQNAIQDCWFLSTLSTLSNTKKGKSLIKQSLNYTRKGIEVTFKGLNKTYEITNAEIKKAKSEKEADNTPTHTQGDDDVIAFELALEKLSSYIADNEISVNKNTADFNSNEIVNGNSPGFAMEILGIGSESETKITTAEDFDNLLNENNENSLNNDLAMILCSHSKGTAQDTNGKRITLDEMHTYGVESISKEDNSVSFTNPWDTTQKITLSINTIKELMESGDLSLRTYDLD